MEEERDKDRERRVGGGIKVERGKWVEEGRDKNEKGIEG